MIEIGDMVQIDYDLAGTALKMGMLGTIVHQHDMHCYEVEISDDTLLDCAFAIKTEQMTVVWSVRQAAWLPTKTVVMRSAGHILKGKKMNRSESLKLAWQNQKNTARRDATRVMMASH